MSDTLSLQVCQLVADVMSVSPSLVTLDSSPDTIDDWDSVKQLSLAVAVEERFQVELSPEEIENISDVRALVELLRARGV